MIRLSAVLLAFVVAGCAGQAGPSSAAPPSATPPVGSAVSSSPSASHPAATASASTAATQPHRGTGKIVFSRHNSKTDDGGCFTINPDGSLEATLHAGGCGSISPDGRKVVIAVFKPNGFGPLLGGRPATSNVDGSGFRLLDAYPGSKLNLTCSSWSPDGTRFLCESGEDTVASDDGIYTVRSSDGGDLRRLTTAPAQHEDQPQGYSPDGSKILFERLSDTEPNALFAIKTDGTGLVRLSPADLSAYDLGLPAGWSPDGSRVAFGAIVLSVGFTALFVVNADGTGLKQLSSTDVGGATAQWSPEGRWIAFTSRYCCSPQVWVVHPDGTGLAKLTDGSDGSSSLFPIWSPDSSQLLFQQQLDVQSTLWTMNADGTSRLRLADPGPGFDGVGPSSWGRAPTP